MSAHVTTTLMTMTSSGGNMTSNMTVSNTTDDYEYVYDYDTTESVSLAELIPVSIVYGLTLVLGAVGNSLVIICIAKYRRMHSVTNIFLVSLASADLLLVCACVPIKFAKFFTFTWWFGELLCKFVHYLQNVSVICSVLTLTVLSLERYYAILRPMQARSSSTSSRTKKIALLIWALSFTLALPILKGQVLREVGEMRVGYWCVKEWSQPLYEMMYEIYMLLLVLVIPLSAMTFAYASIGVELWIVTTKRVRMTATSQYHRTSRSEGHAVTSSVDGEEAICGMGGTAVSGRGDGRGPSVALDNDDNKTRKQVIKMLLAIVVLFAVCWSPSLIDGVLVAFGHLSRLNYGHMKYVRQAFSIMSYFNSCVNPIVYAFMSRNFRTGFRNTLCACAGRRSELHGQGFRSRQDQDVRWHQTGNRVGGNGKAGGLRNSSFQQSTDRGRFLAATPASRGGRCGVRGGSTRLERISMISTQVDGRNIGHHGGSFVIGGGNGCVGAGGGVGCGSQLLYNPVGLKTELYDMASSNFD